MNKIIVTGATSMIGVALIEEAVKHDVEVYAIVRPNTNRAGRLPKTKFIHIVYSDLDGLEDVSSIPEGCEVFYHFAWAGTNKETRDAPIIQESNIRYTLAAVDLAHKFGCKKFIGAGSQAEYGPVDGRIDENTRFKPVTSYGITKFASGLLSKKLCEQYGMVHIWGRIFSVYGPHDNEGTMLDYAIEQFSNGKEAKFSAGTQMWNYLYETDAGMMFYLMGEKIEENMTYRIAHVISRPLRQYIEEISQIMDARALCSFTNETRSGTVYGIETYDEKLFNDIGFRPQISYVEGIKKMIEMRMR